MNVMKIFVLTMIALLATTFVSAQDLSVQYVKINGEKFDAATVGEHTNNLQVERGEDISIKVRVKATADVENVQVEADIYGYKYSHKEESLVSATSRAFDMSLGDVDDIELELQVPVKMDKKYTLLRLRVGDEDGASTEYIYQLHVVGVAEEDAVVVNDFSFNPSSTINAGRAFTAIVRVENIGDNDLDDVKVTVSVPQLNIKDSEYLDELVADEKETLDEFLLRIPDCATPGVYDVEIEVEFDEYESTTESAQITVISGDSCSAQTSEGKTVITVPEAQDVSASSEVAYPIMIANQGTSAKTFTVSVSGVDSWGSSRLSPSAITIVPAGESKTVYLYVQANDDAEGEQVFMTTVSSNGESKEIPLTANVLASSTGGGLKSGLEVALVVLVIILIIVGLIIGFNKLRGNDEDGTQTYY